MKKKYFFILLLTLCFKAVSFSQGSETFAKATNLSTSYLDRNFLGESAITWTYIASRNGNGDANSSGISLPALMLRRSADNSKITSSTISGGIGNFSVKLYKGFTSAGNRQVELFINGVSKGTSTPFDDYDEHIFTVPGINITGDIIIEIKTLTSKQIIIDDITWTAPSSDPSLSVVSPTDNTVFTASTTEVPVTLNTSNFTLSGDNGSEMSDNTGDGYILATLQEIGGGVPESNNIFTTSLEPINVDPGKSYTVNLKLVDNNGAPLSPKVETSLTFSVEFPCDLQLGTITTTCVANTAGVDLYNATIDFTGGNTSTYTLGVNSGTIEGDNPSTVASGTITITGAAEGTAISFTATGDASNSSCELTLTIDSPNCLPAPTCSAVGAIIITEIMQNPSEVNDNDGEYFEVYNTTTATIDMVSWIVKAGSKTETVATSLIIPANGYLVLGINEDINTNGGVTVNYQYNSNLVLANSSGSISLECTSAEIDAVAWDDGVTFPDPTGKSMELAANKYNSTDNDTGSNWAEATSEIKSGGDLGTPGSVNDFTLSVRKNDIVGFTTYPNPISKGKFTISSSNSDEKEVSIFNILGREVLSQSFSGGSKSIEVNSLDKGVYILKVKEGNNVSTKKLVIR